MPFTDLVPDVLALLIEAYVHIDDSCSHPAIRISHVCSTLREAALRTPNIWNNILIHSSKTSSLELARIFAERAGSRAKIKMVVDLVPPISADNLEIILGFIEAYAPSLLELGIYIASYSLTIQEQINAMLDRMDSVQLRGLAVGHDHAYSSQDLHLRLHSFPSIRHLAMFGLLLDPYNSSYNALAHLTVGRIQAVGLLQVLSQARQLQHLRLLQIYEAQSPYSVDAEPVTISLLKLKSLKVDSCMSYVVTFILHILDAPVLETVEISIVDSYLDRTTPIRTYLPVTMCRIEAASCKGGGVYSKHPCYGEPTAIVTRLMRAFPAIQFLHVPFDIISIILNNSDIAENLTDLCIVRPTSLPLDDFDREQAFICLTKYIRFRRDAERPLHSIKFMDNLLDVDHYSHWNWEVLRASLNRRLSLVDHDSEDV